jgi:hypothetical protein
MHFALDRAQQSSIIESVVRLYTFKTAVSGSFALSLTLSFRPESERKGDRFGPPERVQGEVRVSTADLQVKTAEHPEGRAGIIGRKGKTLIGRKRSGRETKTGSRYQKADTTATIQKGRGS